MKNNVISRIMLICFLMIPHASRTSNAVTYALTSWRFGDSLLEYIKAKWVSHTYNLPFLYKPFAESDKLLLHTKEQRYDLYTGQFTGIREIYNEGQINFGANSSTLFVTNYRFQPSDWGHSPHTPLGYPFPTFSIVYRS